MKKLLADCYKCQFRGEVTGSVHSSCHHPSVRMDAKNPLAEVMSLLGGGRAMPLPSKAAEILKIQADAYGIRSGWFAWPYNFDPIWLKNCDGFKAKEENK